MPSQSQNSLAALLFFFLLVCSGPSPAEVVYDPVNLVQTFPPICLQFTVPDLALTSLTAFIRNAEVRNASKPKGGNVREESVCEEKKKVPAKGRCQNKVCAGCCVVLSGANPIRVRCAKMMNERAPCN
jgi:hypothetical protein